MASCEGGGNARAETRLREEVRVRSICGNFMMAVCGWGDFGQAIYSPSRAFGGRKEQLERKVVKEVREDGVGDKAGDETECVMGRVLRFGDQCRDFMQLPGVNKKATMDS